MLSDMHYFTDPVPCLVLRLGKDGHTEVRRLVRDGETTEQAARALLDDLCSAMVDVLRRAPR